MPGERNTDGVQPSGPPPRPPINVKPMALPAPPPTPRRLYVSGWLWLISALLSLPTAVYAAKHFDQSSAALFDQIGKNLQSGADIDKAHTLADVSPKVVTVAVLVVVVIQLVLVALMITKRSRAARGLLLIFAIAGVLALVVWHNLIFASPKAPNGIFEAILFAQIAFAVIATLLMFGKRIGRWFRGEPDPVPGDEDDEDEDD